LLEYISKFCTKDDIVIDVGANIGNHSIYFSGISQACVYSVEPVHINFVHLVTNAAINRLTTTIYPINIALGNDFEEIKLQSSIENNNGSFRRVFTTSTANSAESYTVKADWLFIEKYKLNTVKIIKVDIEGMELDFLKGAIRLITRDLPMLAIECHSAAYYEEISDFLKPLGYFSICVFEMGPTFIFISHQNKSIFDTYLSISSADVKNKVSYPLSN
jgi:FkbM family methyltransferase